MQNIAPAEIANILFLAGVYTGVDNFAEALKAEIALLKTLDELARTTPSPTPIIVVTALQKAFPGPSPALVAATAAPVTVGGAAPVAVDRTATAANGRPERPPPRARPAGPKSGRVRAT
jgi:hypothetical protein